MQSCGRRYGKHGSRSRRSHRLYGLKVKGKIRGRGQECPRYTDKITKQNFYLPARLSSNSSATSWFAFAFRL
jgi:hypothetical protein